MKKILAATSLLVIGVVGARLPKQPPIDPSDALELSTEQVDLFPDGGLAYSKLARSRDAGVHGRVKVAGPLCVRRPVGVAVINCRRNTPGAGGPQDEGEMNKFLATEASGAGCETVACGIMAGESPAETDAQKHARLLVVFLADGGAP
jgi:hypothetical protein